MEYIIIKRRGGACVDYIDRIRALRKAQGLTQKDMADVLGVATSMYNMYETRQRRMYVETFATLCSYFGVSADDLLGTGKEE